MPDPKLDDLLRDAGEEPGHTEGSAEGGGDPARAGPIEEPGATRSKAEGEDEVGDFRHTHRSPAPSRIC